jgi:hypothetical protein
VVALPPPPGLASHAPAYVFIDVNSINRVHAVASREFLVCFIIKRNGIIEVVIEL